MLDPVLAPVARAQAHLDGVAVGLTGFQDVDEVPVPVFAILGMDQTCDQIRILQEFIGRVAAQFAAGRRDIAIVSVRAEPIFPIRAVFGEHLILLATLTQTMCFTLTLEIDRDVKGDRLQQYLLLVQKGSVIQAQWRCLAIDYLNLAHPGPIDHDGRRLHPIGVLETGGPKAGFRQGETHLSEIRKLPGLRQTLDHPLQDIIHGRLVAVGFAQDVVESTDLLETLLEFGLTTLEACACRLERLALLHRLGPIDDGADIVIVLALEIQQGRDMQVADELIVFVELKTNFLERQGLALFGQASLPEFGHQATIGFGHQAREIMLVDVRMLEIE